MNNAKLKPALIGGIFLGLLTIIPFISFANICCCLWVWLGGGLAAHLYIKQSETMVSPGEGATVGLMAGGVGSLIYLFIGLPIGFLTGDLTQRILLNIYRSASPELARTMEKAFTDMNNLPLGQKLLQAIPFVILQIILILAFAAVGGLLGTKLLEKRQPAQAMPPVPPPDFSNYQ